jgi:hypothetical protein
MRKSPIIAAVVVFIFAVTGLILRQMGVQNKWLMIGGVCLVAGLLQYIYFRNK